jgi:Ankyrin repeat.
MKKILLLCVLAVFMLGFVLPLRAQEMSLTNAIMQGDLKEVKRILKPTLNTEKDNISFLMSVVENQYKIAKFFLSQGSNPNFIFEGKTSPLQEAISRGNVKMVKLLISKGADVNLEVIEKPIVFLSKECSFYPTDSLTDKNKPYDVKTKKKILNILISKGADINAKDNDGLTPLDLVQEREIKDFLISKGAKSSKDLK